MHERLVVVDCNAGTGIFVEGEVDPQNNFDLGGGPARKISMIQKPRGPLRLTPDTTIEKLAATAKRSGLDYTTDLDGDGSEVGESVGFPKAVEEYLVRKGD